MMPFAVGLSGNALAALLTWLLWGDAERALPRWATGFPMLLVVLTINVAGWLVVFA